MTGGATPEFVDFSQALSGVGDGINDAAIAYDAIGGATSTTALLAILGAAAAALAVPAAATDGNSNNITAGNSSSDNLGGGNGGSGGDNGSGGGNNSNGGSGGDNGSGGGNGDNRPPLPTGTTTITAIDPDTGIKGNFITSATQLTVKGTVTGLNNGETVQVRIGEGEWGTATITGNEWSFDNTGNSLPEGNHPIQTRIVNNGGDIKDTASRTVEIDNTDPDSATIDSVVDAASFLFSVITPGDTVSAQELHFSGTAEAGTIVTIHDFHDGDTIVATVEVEQDGNWAVATDPLDHGQRDLHVIVTDPAGNQSEREIFPLTIDIIAPDAPEIISVEDNFGLIKGSLASGSVTDDTTPTFKGTAEAGAKITIQDGNLIVGTANVDNNGNWEVTTDVLAEGVRNLTITATDAAGNISDATNFVLNIDITAPTAMTAITSITPDTGASNSDFITSNKTPTVNGTVSGLGAGEVVQVRIGTSAWTTVAADSSGKWNFAAPSLTDGKHDIQTQIVDLAGNVKTGAAKEITIDATAPNAPALTEVYDDVGTYKGALTFGDVTDDATPTFRGTAEVGSTITIKNGAVTIDTTQVKADGTWEFTTPELTDGAYNFSITATDVAGNVSDATDFALTIDTAPPASGNSTLRVKILGSNGETVPFNSQVMLYDEDGKLVATKFVNPVLSNVPDVSGIVEFDNLDPTKNYSLRLSYIKGDKTIDFGGEDSLGGVKMDRVSSHWSGLTTDSAATTILEARADENVSGEYMFAYSRTGQYSTEVPSWYNVNDFDYIYKVTDHLGRNKQRDLSERYSWKIGINKLFSGSSDLVGTDSDDIFQASSSYNLNVSNNGSNFAYRQISMDVYLDSTLAQRYNGGAGVDIVDYSGAFQYRQVRWGNWSTYKKPNRENGYSYVKDEMKTGITVDLSNEDVQNTGFNYAKFLNIEGIYGTNAADTITDSAADNIFEGRGGDDVFYLVNGGFDTLLYKVIDDGDSVGGNGTDSVHGFTIGMYGVAVNTDRIDLSDLLIGYVADADGPAHWVDGVATIDAGDSIKSYLSTHYDGSATVLYIDRDGAQESEFASTALVRLEGVHTDLETLLANQQIIVG